MMAFWGDSVKRIAQQLTNLHEEFITTRVQFKNLQENVQVTISEFKSLVESSIKKANEVEKDHIRENAALKAQIMSLENRLDMLSEHALQVAMKEVAQQAVIFNIENSKNNRKYSILEEKEKNENLQVSGD